jgi:hypothetical protein
MVGNPYMQFITWSKLKIAYNGQKVSIATASDDSHKWIKSYGWVWEKDPSTQAWQYSLVNSRLHNNTILAFQACWIMASVECDLYMAAPATNMSQQSSSIAAVAPKNMPQPGEWMVRIGADNGDLRDDFNYLGVNLSKPEVIQSPVYPSRHVDLYFTRPDGSGRYAYDLRTGGNPGEAWTFYVETDTPGDITLTWDNIPTVPEGTKLVLTDDSAGISQDMVAGGVYTFRLDSAGRRRFRIVAGKM